MSFTDSQRETLNGLSTGLHMNSGEPCECGPEEYSTRREHAFSDSMVYHHRCGECGNEFSTWTEG